MQTETLAANIVQAFRAADPTLKRHGLDWYPTARAMAVEVGQRAGLTPRHGAAVIAALSPQNAWESNVRWALECADAHANGADLPSRGLGNSLRRAAIALSGDLSDIERTKGTLKVHNFYRSIMGERGAVCVDRHAVRIALGDRAHNGNITSDGMYNRFAAAYLAAGSELHIAARKVQAATWCDFRGTAY